MAAPPRHRIRRAPRRCWPMLTVDVDLHRRTAARVRQLQRAAQPVEGAVVLPRSPGTPRLLRPPWSPECILPGIRPRRPGDDPLYRQATPRCCPADRKLAIMIFTFFIMSSASVLTIFGSFFRGPGFNFVFPWRDGIFFDDLKSLLD